MNITLEVKTHYGTQYVYPVCETAATLYEIIAAEFKKYADCDHDYFDRLDAAGFAPEKTHRARYSRLKLLANSLAVRLAQDNSRFDRNTFMTACGL